MWVSRLSLEILRDVGVAAYVVAAFVGLGSLSLSMQS